MKTMLRMSLTGFFLAVLVLSYGLPSRGYTIEDVEKARNYEKDVAKNMQELVPVERYETVSGELSELRDPITGGNLLSLETVMKIAASPCSASLIYLARQYATDPATQKALAKINRGLQNLPVGYTYPNPWKGHKDATELVRQLLIDFTAWCTFLPDSSGSHDSGLKYIQHFAWFYYRNAAGQDFVQGRDPNNRETPLITGVKFTRDFSNERGAFMNSTTSLSWTIWEMRWLVSDMVAAP